MAADLDSGGYEADAETVKLTETRSAAADDAYNIDPDTENYAVGNDPETAYRDIPNSSNGDNDAWNEPDDQDGDAPDTGDENAETREEEATESSDLWDDTDPDAANYADLDAQPDRPPPDREASAKPDEPQPEPADHERRTPEQERISVMEAKNAEQAARLDRIEQLLTGRDRQPYGTAAPGRAGDSPATSADQPEPRDAATGKHHEAIVEQEGTRQASDAKEAKHHSWRRATSAENVGIAGSLVGATDTVAQFAMHATPEGMVGLTAMALGLASVGLAKLEKNKEKRGKP